MNAEEDWESVSDDERGGNERNSDEEDRESEEGDQTEPGDLNIAAEGDENWESEGNDDERSKRDEWGDEDQGGGDGRSKRDEWGGDNDEPSEQIEEEKGETIFQQKEDGNDLYETYLRDAAKDRIDQDRQTKEFVNEPYYREFQPVPTGQLSAMAFRNPNARLAPPLIIPPALLERIYALSLNAIPFSREDGKPQPVQKKGPQQKQGQPQKPQPKKK